jgi:hypothetical protein
MQFDAIGAPLSRQRRQAAGEQRGPLDRANAYAYDHPTIHRRHLEML